MSRWRTFSIDRAEGIALSGAPESFWSYVDSAVTIPDYLREDSSAVIAARAECPALNSRAGRCTQEVRVGDPMCEMHMAKATEWLVARVGRSLVGAYRRAIADREQEGQLRAAEQVARNTPDKVFVYFYELEGQGLIKIGSSARPTARVAQFSRGKGCTFPKGADPSAGRLIGYYPASRAAERELHNLHRGLWVAGEWFRKTPELTALIDRLVAGEGGVAA